MWISRSGSANNPDHLTIDRVFAFRSTVVWRSVSKSGQVLGDESHGRVNHRELELNREVMSMTVRQAEFLMAVATIADVHWA